MAKTISATTAPTQTASPMKGKATYASLLSPKMALFKTTSRPRTARDTRAMVSQRFGLAKRPSRTPSTIKATSIMTMNCRAGESVHERSAPMPL